MTGATAQQPAWPALWDVFIVGLCAVGAVSVFLLDGLVPGRWPAGAAGLLIAMAAWLTTAGRGVVRMGPLGVRSVGYVTVGAVTWAAAVWFAPVSVAALPALYPVLFSTLPLGAAVAGAIAVTLVPLTFDLVAHGVQTPHLPLVLAITLMGLIAGPITSVMVISSVRQQLQLATVVAELEDSRSELARLSREAGVAAERQRLAREIHDTLAQGFTSIVMLAQATQAELGTDVAGAGASEATGNVAAASGKVAAASEASGNVAAAARHIELIRDTARANLSEARTMVSSLTPEALDSGTLTAAICRQCDAFAAETGISVRVDADPQLPTSAMASNVVLLRATQEALANIRRHAQASAVTVELSASGNELRLSLSDNGIGLDDQYRPGYGLTGMRTRVEQVGGALTLRPTPGGGVTVVVEVPA